MPSNTGYEIDLLALVRHYSAQTAKWEHRGEWVFITLRHCFYAGRYVPVMHIDVKDIHFYPDRYIAEQVSRRMDAADRPQFSPAKGVISPNDVSAIAPFLTFINAPT